MEKTSDAGKAERFCREEKGAGAEFICSVDSVDRGMSGKLTVHTQKRQIHPTAYSEVYLSHSPHRPRSQKATPFNMFLVLLVVTFHKVPKKLIAIISWFVNVRH